MSSGDLLLPRSWWRRWRLWLLLPLPLLLVLVLLFPVPSARLVAGMAPELAYRCARRCALQGVEAFQRLRESSVDEYAAHLRYAELCFSRARSIFRRLSEDDQRWGSATVKVTQYYYACVQRSLDHLRASTWQQAWSPDFWWRPMASGRETIFPPQNVYRAAD